MRSMKLRDHLPVRMSCRSSDLFDQQIRDQ
jgi:hypothetical protein